MIEPFATILDPARFQSRGRERAHFEGWYFKLCNAECAEPLAVIPGISVGEGSADAHAFVQVLRTGGRVAYHRYPIEQFRAARDRFEVRIGPNHFSAEGIRLHLEGSDGIIGVSGALTFGPWRGWPVSLREPGVMGWYRYVPRMECYHAALSFDHSIDGMLVLGEPDGTVNEIDYRGGRGYCEKDWGTGFPSSWVWAQCNHFEGGGRAGDGPSLFCSVARIPWLGSSFTGHIAGLLLDGELHRFATYTGSKILAVETTPGSAHVAVGDRRRRLEFTVTGGGGGALKAPLSGVMTGRADEMLDAEIDVELHRIRGGRAGVVWQGHGTYAGAEIMNAARELRAG
jgi:hypothetical protein